MANLSAGAAANLLMAMVAVAPVARPSSSAAHYGSTPVQAARQATAKRPLRRVSDKV